MKNITILITVVLLSFLYAVSANAGSNNVFNTKLSGAQQVVATDVNGVSIPIKGLVTGAFGKAAFRISPDRSMIAYKLKVANTATPIFMAHLHLGPKGQNGPVVLWLYGNRGVNANFPRDDGEFTGKIEGTLMADAFVPPTDSEGRVLISTFEDLVANIANGNTYINVHTVAHPGGEVRGQMGQRHHGRH